MTKYSGMAKRLIAVVIALTLLFSMCMTAAVPASASDGSITYADGLVPATDENVRYTGHWAEVDGNMKGYFESTVEIKFTGNTFALDATAKTAKNAFLVSIDGGDWELYDAGNVSFTDLGEGEHTATIISNFQHINPVIKGFTIDAGAKTLVPDELETVAFIGDSITLGYYGGDATLPEGYVHSFKETYAMELAQMMGWVPNATAIGGIGIDVANSTGIDVVGMTDRYFKLGEFTSDAQDVDYDTSLYAPNYVVIALGTNGNNGGLETQQKYEKFLEDLRVAYPDTVIFCTTPFQTTGVKPSMLLKKHVIAQSVANRVAAGDNKVFFIDATEYITDPSTETCDSVHPTYETHENIANLLIEDILAIMDDYDAAVTNPYVADLTDVATSAKDNFYYARDGVRHKRNETIYITYSRATDIVGGGVRVGWEHSSAAAPFEYNKNLGEFPGDGIRLQFANYKINATDSSLFGYGQIIITLGNKTGDGQRIKKDVPYLQLDTVSGKLILGSCKDISYGTSFDPITDGFNEHQVIIQSDSLMYANVEGKPFSISIQNGDDGDYLVTIDLDGEILTGSMDKELFHSLAYAANANTYVAVGGLDNSSKNANKWEIDFYGYEALPEIMAPNDIDAALVNDLTVVAKKDMDTTAIAATRKVLNVVGGGVNINYTANSLSAPFVFSSNLGRFPAYGMKLQFSNYVNNATDTTAAGYGKIAVALAATTVGVAGLENVPFLQIDTVNGTLKLCHVASGAVVEDETIITNNIIKNLEGKAFSIEIAADYTVTFTAGAESASGKLTASKFNAIANHANALGTYVAVSGLDDTSAWSVSFHGYKLTPSNLAEGLDGVATSEDDYVIRNDIKTIKDLIGGGVNVKFTQYSCYEPYHYPVNFVSLDGLELQLANYYSYNTDTSLKGHGKLAFMLSNASAGTNTAGAATIKFKPGVLVVVINTVDGTLELVKVTADDMTSYEVVRTLATNDALKYANFANRPFTIAFDKDGTNTVVSVAVEGTTVTGSITADEMAAFKYAPTNTAAYVSIGGVNNTNNNAWSVDFYGYNKEFTEQNSQVAGGTVDNLINTINNIPDNITLDNANIILTAKALYDSFAAANKELVTNAADLTLAYNTLVNLQTNATYKANATYLAGEQSVSNANYRSLFSSSTEDGFKMDYNRAANIADRKLHLSQTLTGRYALDGLYVSFKNFNYTKQSDFFVAFTNSEIEEDWNGTADLAKEQIVVYLGKDSTELLIAGCGNAAPISLGSNPILKRSNLVGKDISVEWHAGANGAYNLFITVDSKVAGFTVTASMMNALTSFDASAVRVLVGTNAVGNDFEIEVDGVYANTASNVKAVIDTIAALNAESDATAVNAANEAYAALSTADKQLVINYPELNALRQALRTVGEDGKDAAGYYVPTTDDILNDGYSAPLISAADNGGIHLDMNNAPFGSRIVLEDTFIAEDLTLRFDNYNYAMGGLIVGITSANSVGAGWNFGSGVGRSGVFLLIGQDSSIYATEPYLAKQMRKIITDPVLARENLINKEILVGFDYNAENGDFYVTVTVDGKELSFNLNTITCEVTHGKYTESMDQFKYEKVKIVVENFASYKADGSTASPEYLSAASIDFTGIDYKENSDAQTNAMNAVIDAIDALPNTPSLDIEDEVTAVWNQYFELTLKKLRDGVTNYDKLLTLHDGIFNLKLGNNNVTEYVDVDVDANEIDNSSLVTPYKPDSEVAYDSTGIWPEWTKDLVMAEINLKKASANGTILAEDIEPLLAHLAETGINGLWVTPINDMGTDKTSAYCNYGPHTIDPYLTGVLAAGADYSTFNGDYTQAFANFKTFVDLAHTYNIRIFIDIVPWGLSKQAPLVTEHPEWFIGESSWGGLDYDLDNAAVQAYYKGAVIDTYLATGVDGIRWDLEPNYFGYDLVEEIRDALKAEGKKPLFFSEDLNNRTNDAYAFEQCYGVVGDGVGSQTVSSVFFNDVDIVEAITTGKNIAQSTAPSKIQDSTYGAAKYYAYQISSHDVLGYRNASHASWAYEFAFSSFIPILYVGEEYNATASGALMGAGFDAAAVEANKDYYESVKKLLQLRWMYKDLVNDTVDNHKDTNIISVDVTGTDHVKGYARYAGNQALVVVPNVNEKSTAAAEFTVELPITAMGLGNYSNYTVTDLLTGDMVASGSALDIQYFSETIDHNTAGVYLVSGNTSDVTWSLDEDGTLTVNGTGAIESAPWAAANSTAKKVVFSEGITSVPADALDNFNGVTAVQFPSTMTTFPEGLFDDCADGVVAIVIEGSEIEAAAIAAGIPCAYSALSANGITISYVSGSIFASGDTLKVSVATDAAVAKVFGNANADMYTVDFVPAETVNVQIAIDAAMNAENVALYSVDGTKATLMEADIANGVASFTTDTLGKYAVVEYNAEYADAFELSEITVVVNEDGTKTVNAIVDQKLATFFTGLGVTFADQLVTEYAVVGNDLVFSYTTDANATVEVVLSGTYVLGAEYTADAVTTNLARLNGEAGTKFVQYLTLNSGDANEDGVTDIKDLVRTKKIIAELEAATTGADLSGDNVVANTDLVLLAKLIVSGKNGMEAHTVTLVDEDGTTVLEVLNVPTGFGAIPTVVPTKVGDEFKQWSGSLANITKDITLTAEYKNSVEGDFSEDDLSGKVPGNWELGDE